MTEAIAVESASAGCDGHGDGDGDGEDSLTWSWVRVWSSLVDVRNEVICTVKSCHPYCTEKK
jgi:hypothetical protein